MAESSKYDPIAVKMAGEPKQKRSVLQKTIGSASNMANNAIATISKASGQLEAKTEQLGTTTARELLIFKKYASDIGKTVRGTTKKGAAPGALGKSGIAGEGGAIDSLSVGLAGTLNGVLDTVRSNTGAISNFTGGLLGSVNNVLQNPLDADNLSNLTSSLLDSVAPGMSAKIGASAKKLNLDRLAKVPQQLMTSANNLITAVDNLLAVPIAFLAEIYYGAIGILKRIAKEINQLLDVVLQFIFNFLDSLIPISQILQLLDTVGTLAGQIGGIAGTFGVNQISGIANLVTSYTNQITNIFQNPLDLIVSYLPPEINNIYNSLQNPQTLINQFLPKELSSAFSTISKMTGYGFNGNMGFAIDSVLQGVKGGVLRSIISNYSSQYSVLKPLLGGQGQEIPQGFLPLLFGGAHDTGLNRRNKVYESPYVGIEITDPGSKSRARVLRAQAPDVRKAIPVN
jgi:hypothetical protein